MRARPNRNATLILRVIVARLPQRLDRLGNHLDRTARALGNAQPAALAVVVVELEALAWPEFDYRVVRADTVAIVALEAVAARKAPACLEERIRFIQSALHLVERRLPAYHVQHRAHGFRRVGVVPRI